MIFIQQYLYWHVLVFSTITSLSIYVLIIYLHMQYANVSYKWASSTKTNVHKKSVSYLFPFPRSLTSNSAPVSIPCGFLRLLRWGVAQSWWCQLPLNEARYSAVPNSNLISSKEVVGPRVQITNYFEPPPRRLVASYLRSKGGQNRNHRGEMTHFNQT